MNKIAFDVNSNGDICNQICRFQKRGLEILCMCAMVLKKLFPKTKKINLWLTLKFQKMGKTIIFFIFPFIFI